MKRAVGERNSDIHHRKAERTRAQTITNALFNGRDILAGNGTADDLFAEFETFATAKRANVDCYISKLAVTAGLLFIASTCAGRFAYGFLIACLDGCC